SQSSAARAGSNRSIPRCSPHSTHQLSTCSPDPRTARQRSPTPFRLMDSGVEPEPEPEPRTKNQEPRTPNPEPRTRTMKHLPRDLKYALRGLARSPLFTTVALLSIALGIGANTAIFTLVDEVLLRKLPVKAPQQLVLFTGPR